MSVPTDLKYTKEHEWVRIEGDTATFGVTDHAQEALGDIVFVELPEVGRSIDAGEAYGVVESVKAVSDVYAPVAGEVIEVNEALEGEPDLVNSDPYGTGLASFLRHYLIDKESDALCVVHLTCPRLDFKDFSKVCERLRERYDSGRIARRQNRGRRRCQKIIRFTFCQ